MNNFKSFFKPILDFSLIIILGALLYPQIRDKDSLLVFSVFIILIVLYIILIIKDYFKIKKLKREDQIKECKKEFNDWYAQHLREGKGKCRIGLQDLTPYEMFGEVVKNSKKGQKILKIVEKEINKSGEVNNAFRLRQDPNPLLGTITNKKGNFVL